jgi:hypothetical protein
MIKPLGQRPVGRHMGTLVEETKDRTTKDKTAKNGKREKVLN